MAWCLKYYECTKCRIKWTDAWSCACNDRCPNCRTEIEPYDDEELTYVVESDPAGKFTVMFSPDSADDSPDYESIGVFGDEADALALVRIQQGL